MPDRAMELRHLAQADRHIREGERREHVVQGAIDRSVALNMNADHARVLLLLIGDGIAAIKAHRLLILRSIDDIDRRGVATQTPD
mgnify:CR=1 FL=1